MELSVTQKYQLYTYLAGASLVLTVVFVRLEFLLLGLPFLITMIWPHLWAQEPVYRLRSETFGRQGFEEDETRAQLGVDADTDLPLLEVTHRVAGRRSLAQEDERWVFSLPSQESTSLTSTVDLASRGHFRIGRFRCRAADPSLSWWWGSQEAPGDPFSVFPRLRRFDLYGKLAREVGLFHGDHLSRSRGEGMELAGIREYTRGDSAGQINWRHSLRWGKLHINQRTPERNTDVVIIVDTLRDVGRWPFTTLNSSARGAANLANFFLQRKDRVGLIEYGGPAGYITPSSGTRQLYAILDRLARMELSTSTASRDVRTLPPRSLPPKAQVFVFTTLLDRRSSIMVKELAIHGFRPMVIYMQPESIVEALLDERAKLDRLALKYWRMLQKEKLHELESGGLPVVSWDGESPLESHLFPVFSAQRRR